MEEKDNNTTPPPGGYKIEKGSNDYNFFHSLIKTWPGFLSLTASKIKKQFPQFDKYPTPIVNQALTNARKQQKKIDQSKKKEEPEKMGKTETLTDEQKSKL